MIKKGLVRYGINNIFTVDVAGILYEARIKGKVLQVDKPQYNPIAAGDWVDIEIEDEKSQQGMILKRHPRKSQFSRYNKKRKSPQVIAANLDLLVCVCSPVSPPFRPRFIDRVFIAADQGQLPMAIVLNKIDQGLDESIKERLEDFERLKVKTFFVSATESLGLEELAPFLGGKTVGFVGQSGVGKSALLNALFPQSAQEVGNLNKKFNRGNHTTCYAILMPWEKGALVDTPGVREFELEGIYASTLGAHFPDFVPYIPDCVFPGCTHTHEPGCQVKEGVEKGWIHPDRYLSYLNLFKDLTEQEKRYGS